MAHEVETMAYAGETPWHGLGELVSNDLTPAQMLKKANLDWQVEKRPMMYKSGSSFKVVSGKNVLVRSSDEKVLDVVGSDWNPVQNDDAFEFFSEYVFAGDMEMHTAGSLRGGQMVWALAKVKESFDLFGGDTVESYLLFSNPHQYGKSIDIRFTPIRVVCNNTLTLSLSTESSRSVRVGHRAQFNPNEVKEALGIASNKLGVYKEMAEFLGKKRFTMDRLVEYYNTVFPSGSKKDRELTVDSLSRNAKQALEVLNTQPGHEFAEGSWWQAFNSVTYVTDHIQGRNADNRLYSNWFGGNQLRKKSAIETAIKFAEMA